MTAVLSPPVKIAPYLFRYEWTGTAPFRVFNYLHYRYEYQNTDLTRIDLVSPWENQAIALQVLDSTDGELDGITYPGICRVQWRGIPTAYKYEVRLSNTALTYTFESGKGYYQYTFEYYYDAVINNGTVTVICYDSEGNTKSVILPSISIVTVPFVTELSCTYDDGTNTITVDNA